MGATGGAETAPSVQYGRPRRTLAGGCVDKRPSRTRKPRAAMHAEGRVSIARWNPEGSRHAAAHAEPRLLGIGDSKHEGGRSADPGPCEAESSYRLHVIPGAPVKEPRAGSLASTSGCPQRRSRF